MAKKSKEKTLTPWQKLVRFTRRVVLRSLLIAAAFVVFMVLLYSVFNPPVTPYILSESRRLGDTERTWVDIDQMAPVMTRSAVAAEDANFCEHWGFDVNAIRAALEDGGARGASTITQQVVKNTYLWHGRSWLRKALEALITPVVEAIWSKQRIIEVYLNVAEFDEGVFGVEAASQHYYGVSAIDLSPRQAAQLAAVLPNPKRRDAANLSSALRKRASAIADGAATIQADGRANCFVNG